MSLILEEVDQNDYVQNIEFPLRQLVKVEIEGVHQYRVDQTIRKIVYHQKHSIVQSLFIASSLVIIGLLVLYVALVACVLSLFNPFIMLIAIGCVFRYVKWIAKLIRKRIIKRQRLNVKDLLESENRGYYAKKLIKWKFDDQEQNILIYNLRYM